MTLSKRLHRPRAIQPDILTSGPAGWSAGPQKGTKISMLDVIIAGGGPAGLNAALVLGRVRRRVLLADAGNPRNAASEAVHGFLSRDGVTPVELLESARKDLSAYPAVEIEKGSLESIELRGDGFEAVMADQTSHRGRRVLLATGVTDTLPPIEGLADLWGRGVFHCPYCHGWEVRDQPLAVLGGNEDAARLAVYLTRLSDDVVLCTNGPPVFDPAIQQLLIRYGVVVQTDRVARVEGSPGRFERVVFAAGGALARAALFLRPAVDQRSELAAQLRCAMLDDGRIKVDQSGQTSVLGVYAAGDLCRTPEMQRPPGKVVTAAAAGAQAAVTIDMDLVLTDIAEGNSLASAHSQRGQ